MKKKWLVLFMATAAIGIAFASIKARVAQAQDTTPPTTPTNVSAYVTQSGQVYVSWNGSTDDVGVVGYYLYRDGQLVANTPGLLFYTDNAPAGNHTYTASAYDAAGNVSGQSAPSPVITVLADTQPPSAPGNLTLVPSSSSVTLSWDASTDNVAVIGYYIYRNGVKIILPSTITNTSYTDTGLVPGYSYSYSVGAYDAAGNITRTNVVNVVTIFDVTPPSPPRNLSAKAVSPTEIDLAWGPATDNIAVAGYSIFRNNEFVASVDSSTLSYADTNLSAVTNYSYQVTAYDEVGNSSVASTPSSAFTPAPDTTPPSIPGGISGVALSASEINISWQPSRDNVAVAGYYIYRDGSQIASTASTTYVDMNLTTSTTYQYAVIAYDTSGNVSPQTSVAVQTLATNPVAPVVPPAPPQTPPANPPPTNPVTPPAPTSTPPIPSGFFFATLLSFGSRGTAVQNLQLILIARGNLGPAYATGYFGSLTQKAIQQFQCAQGIVCSGTPYTTGYGLVGVRTRKALNTLQGY